MDYYEEFGLSPGATQEEVRQAYRRLARLLHPDRFQDPEMRRLAECQMKRLNAIFAVLSDPARRRAYDLSRAEQGATGNVSGAPAVPGPHAGLLLRRYGPWAVAATAFIVALWSWLPHSSARHRDATAAASPPVTAEAESTRAPAPPEPPKTARPAARTQQSARRPALEPGQEQELERLRRALWLAEAQRDAALAQASRLRTGSTPDAHPAGGHGRAAGGIEEIASPEPAAPPQPPALATGEAVVPGGLAGAWFYLPQALDFASRDMYPPEYIDLVIAEENGIVRGRYRGRYRVTNRAISPEVVFRFEGEANEAGVYRWEGRGGARGEVRLRLLAPERLEVIWLAEELGTQLGLGSGAAVLIRQQP